ncbi:MAG: hypothetical protein R6W48_01075 [Gaiellaceae bacterium]
MRRVVAVLVLVFALAFSASALAGELMYQPTKYWSAGQGAGSTFSSSWVRNSFWKQSSAAWTTVTFIDNVSYSWHFTTKSTGYVTSTWWFGSQVKKAHCVANSSQFYGSCHVYS